MKIEKNVSRQNTIGAAALRSGLVQIFVTCMLTLFSFGDAFAQKDSEVVRVAKIQIDSTQLEKYKAALKEGIQTAVRLEPGVLALYAVSEKGNPTHITVFEIYANADAYKSHIETPHFKKYKSTTKDMVKSLELMETVPIVLGVKTN